MPIRTGRTAIIKVILGVIWASRPALFLNSETMEVVTGIIITIVVAWIAASKPADE